jgi:hypothetical protein
LEAKALFNQLGERDRLALQGHLSTLQLAQVQHGIYHPQHAPELSRLMAIIIAIPAAGAERPVDL